MHDHAVLFAVDGEGRYLLLRHERLQGFRHLSNRHTEIGRPGGIDFHMHLLLRLFEIGDQHAKEPAFSRLAHHRIAPARELLVIGPLENELHRCIGAPLAETAGEKRHHLNTRHIAPGLEQLSAQLERAIASFAVGHHGNARKGLRWRGGVNKWRHEQYPRQ